METVPVDGSRSDLSVGDVRSSAETANPKCGRKHKGRQY